ncbi:hypothetical protein KR044_003974, partial [Drosophila immigrans]
GRATHDIVDKGIQALVNLDHRGAAGAEKNTGDGAGILLQVPDRFLREEMASQGVELPAAGAYATGIAFLPASRMAALDAMRAVEDIIAEEHLDLLAWRKVPVDDSSLGAMARDAEPIFYQLFLAGSDADGNRLTGIDLDRRAWFVRKRAERELGSKGPGAGNGADTVYFPSLSARTIVYKGMLTTPQLREFYLDLQDGRMESALAVVHSRFSTNTFPSWPLAHPFRLLAHNGEINTVRGNENWMRARESQIRSEILGDIDRALPVCDPDGSDTGRFDEALELLHLAGRSLPHAVMMMVPQAWERNPHIDPDIRAFYEYHSALMEAWDGPAALVFTDGTVLGSVLDRNGLRPGRIWVTRDGLVIGGSEAGLLPVPPSEVIERRRIEPGKMFLKIMSKMGIATVASYRGAQLADVTGLSQGFLDEYFTGAVSPISGIGLDEIAADVAVRHRFAFLPRPEEAAHRELEIGGEYKWRREGEYHLFNPETIFKLQHATRTGTYRIFKEYTEKVDNQAKHLATLRGLFELHSDRPSIPVEDVEPVSEIVKRFSTGAMSYGSISAEAHETLAIAMNRLHGKSNSGEGGEDPTRFEKDANGDWRRSAIKQVASGRFGVTSHYLNNCTDIQIKMAQGAKPGEGGQLPPHKVYPWIAEVRVTTPGVGLISPPPHHDIYSIEDLAQLIYDLKSANPDARVHVKLVAEQGVGTVAAGVSKAHADVVLISGHDGGTGASPLNSLKHAGGPW